MVNVKQTSDSGSTNTSSYRGGQANVGNKIPTHMSIQSNIALAMSLLDESLAISTELGMRPLMERVNSRRDILRA